jgi:hypothetical protein
MRGCRAQGGGELTILGDLDAVVVRRHLKISGTT